MKFIRLLFTAFIICFLFSSLCGQHIPKTENKLNEYWIMNGCDSIEGIYEQFSKPFLRLGLLKRDSIYKLIFLTTLLPSIKYEEWNEGDLKAILTPSEEQGVFYCTWYNVNKKPSSRYYIEIKGIYMDLITYRSRKLAQFKKVYSIELEEPVFVQGEFSTADGILNLFNKRIEK